MKKKLVGHIWGLAKVRTKAIQQQQQIEFVLLQISYLFSSVNSVILIIVIRAFQEPMKRLLRTVTCNRWTFNSKKSVRARPSTRGVNEMTIK